MCEDEKGWESEKWWPRRRATLSARFQIANARVRLIARRHLCSAVPEVPPLRSCRACAQKYPSQRRAAKKASRLAREMVRSFGPNSSRGASREISLVLLCSAAPKRRLCLGAAQSAPEKRSRQKGWTFCKNNSRETRRAVCKNGIAIRERCGAYFSAKRS